MIPFYRVSPENKMGMSKPGILCKLLIIPSLIQWSYTTTLFSYSYQLLSFLSSSKFNSIIFLLLSHSDMSNSLGRMDCSMQGFSVLHYLPELVQIHVHWVSDAIQHFILCCPLVLLPLIFPSIRVFSNESVLCIRWPKYWGFSFSICPSNEYSGLISFRIDWFDILVVHGTLKSLPQHQTLGMFT